MLIELTDLIVRFLTLSLNVLVGLLFICIIRKEKRSSVDLCGRVNEHNVSQNFLESNITHSLLVFPKFPIVHIHICGGAIFLGAMLTVMFSK